jgi:DNA-binding transcriptional regulator LsrR (DeoR family)
MQENVLTKPRSYGADDLRLLGKVARMYHERGIRQPEIAAELHISQSRVSRLLQQASDLGIVRTTVTLPSGVFTDVEEDLEARYGLLDSVIVDTDQSSGGLHRALGASAAAYLRETLANGDVIGVSSWSQTLHFTVEAMRPKAGLVTTVVTQLVGGIDDPRGQIRTTRLLGRFANLSGARPVFWPCPGGMNSQGVRSALLGETAVVPVLNTWRQLSVAVMSVESVQPPSQLQNGGSGNRLDQQAELRELRAVGEICLRYFDEEGNLVSWPYNGRILGISVDQLKAVPRRIGIAGGLQNRAAIAAALRGGWINTLVTDLDTARHLLSVQTPMENPYHPHRLQQPDTPRPHGQQHSLSSPEMVTFGSFRSGAHPRATN